MYKIIALDLDGTLTDDEKKITPKTREALLSVQRHGVRIVLASGRQAPGLLREAAALHLEDYHGLLVSYNGARIQDATTGEVLYANRPKRETTLRFLRHLEQYPELSPIVDDGETIFTTDANRHKVKDESRYNNLKIEIVANIADAVEEKGFRPFKVLTAAPNEILVPRLDDIRRGFEAELSFVQSAPWFCEATVKGTSKVAALTKICEQLDVHPDEVMAFGDAQNDVGMVQFAGHGVAMGNACEELKAAADEITLTNNEDGIAVSLARQYPFLA